MNAQADPAKVVLVTGATSGFGEALAVAFARRGWYVLVHGRQEDKARELANRLLREGARGTAVHRADFRSLSEVNELAEAVAGRQSRLDLLVNNAGVGILPERQESADGIELAMQVNYLAPYLLTTKLTPLLAQSGGSVLNIASEAQIGLDFGDFNMNRRWSGVLSYGRSKLAMIMWTVASAEDLRLRGVKINAIHPASLMPTKMTAGLLERIPGGFRGAILRWRLKSRSTLEQGVENTLNALADADLHGRTGHYYREAQVKTPGRNVRDAQSQASLRRISRDLLARFL